LGEVAELDRHVFLEILPACNIDRHIFGLTLLEGDVMGLDGERVLGLPEDGRMAPGPRGPRTARRARPTAPDHRDERDQQQRRQQLLHCILLYSANGTLWLPSRRTYRATHR